MDSGHSIEGASFGGASVQGLHTRLTGEDEVVWLDLRCYIAHVDIVKCPYTPMSQAVGAQKPYMYLDREGGAAPSDSMQVHGCRVTAFAVAVNMSQSGNCYDVRRVAGRYLDAFTSGEHLFRDVRCAEKGQNLIGILVRYYTVGRANDCK